MDLVVLGTIVVVLVVVIESTVVGTLVRKMKMLPDRFLGVGNEGRHCSAPRIEDQKMWLQCFLLLIVSFPSPESAEETAEWLQLVEGKLQKFLTVVMVECT